MTKRTLLGIITGRMVFALALMLCFCGNLALNPGTSWILRIAFAALKTDGTVVAWGARMLVAYALDLVGRRSEQQLEVKCA